MTSIKVSEFKNTAQLLINFGQTAYARGWVPATSGNFSVRLDEQSIAVTSSGKHKGKLTLKDILALDLNGEVLGQPFPPGKPSAETALHTQLYQLFPEVQAVLHVHSLSAVVLSRTVTGDAVIIENHELVKAFNGKTTHENELVVPIVDNDQDINRLASTIGPRLNASCHAYLIRGHGVYVWGASMEEAERHLEALDYLFNAEILERQIAPTTF